MNDFWIDSHRKQEKSYSDLLEELNQKKSLKKYISFSDPYDVFMNIVAGLISESEVHLIDSDFSDIEMENLGMSSHTIEEEIQLQIN